ncbi:MAG: helix-turn-helix domain-containing protein [Thermoanaerobaculia bacterium]
MPELKQSPSPPLGDAAGRPLACTNRLLAALGSVVQQRLQEHTRIVHAQEILFDASQPQFNIYFPNGNTVISLVRGTDEGPQVEVGLIGSEGFANLDLLLTGAVHDDTLMIVQAAGEVTCIAAARLQSEFSTDARTRVLINGYAAMFLEHVSQTAVCNGVHSVVQRLSKWMLELRDRTGSNELQVSHESLSRILGTQRPAVTLAIGALTVMGVISHSRRSIYVRDPEGLRTRACGCFELMQRSLTDFRVQLWNRKQESARQNAG